MMKVMIIQHMKISNDSFFHRKIKINLVFFRLSTMKKLITFSENRWNQTFSVIDRASKNDGTLQP